LKKDFKNLKCIECGCGGYESTLMAREGGAVTVLDYSEKAIEYSKIVSQRMGVLNKIKFINGDILDFCTNEKYDPLWNCGVVEHYQDKEIIRIIKKMVDIAKNKSVIVITFPNLLSPQSIYWMLTIGKSSERYISRKKLKILMENVGLKHVKIKNFHYWLPSFLPAEWAVKISKKQVIKYYFNFLLVV
jgi:2-polyprenyl-3-methyl-5-hydroxy-6-metoxy-1,4-benzoquinol methylase